MTTEELMAKAEAWANAAEQLGMDRCNCATSGVAARSAVAAAKEALSRALSEKEDWRTRFWQIVDGDGPLGLPSDEWNALARLVHSYREKDAEIARDREAIFAEGAREGWMRCGCYHIDLDFEARPEEQAEVERRWPALTARPAASQAEGVAADKDEYEFTEKLCEQLGKLLEDTGNVLKGPPPPLTLHSWHDLPQVAQRMRDVLVRLNDYWLEDFPNGPDGYADGVIHLHETTLQIWRDLRAAIAAAHPQGGKDA